MFSTMTQLILAQTATPPAAAPGGPAGALLQFAPFILMFVVVYFLLIRPASKQRKEHQALLNALKRDDEVITASGVVGKIVSLDDRLITLEIADKVKIRVLRDRIASRFAEPVTQQK